MKIRLLPLLLTSLLINSAAWSADDVEVVADTSSWKCKYCEFEEGFDTRLEGGVGFVSKDSFKFGEYTGMHEKGAYLIGTATSRYRNPETASYWDIAVTDIGLESRSIALQGGTQGVYKAALFYDELPHFISDTASTPFIGSGHDRLTLPAGWVTAGTTAGMTALAGSLDQVDLETRRHRLGMAAMYIPVRNWETSINYRHETREGKRRIAGSFYLNSAELVQPVDYTTDLVDVAASYSGKSWQAKLAYHGSTFQNANDSLVWQNPYTPLVAGADQGELALAPDNQFHQVMASMAFRIGNHSQAMADIAVGRMTQDQDFVAATRNALLVVSPLPTTSLDGRVDTTNANVRWTSDFGDSFRLKADYQYRDRDNKTPRYSYDWVTTDSNVATARANLPYSYTSNTSRLGVEYRPATGMKTSAGYDYQQYERTYQSVEQSEEQTVWASLMARSFDSADVTFRLSHSARKKDGYEVVPELDNPENPLLRKYNMADRDRDQAGVRVDVAVTERSTLGLGVEFADDDYPDSDLGLVSSRQSSIGVDFSTLLSKNLTFNLFVNNEMIRSTVAGSQLYSIPDWSGRMDDTFNTVGAGIKHALIENTLDVGANYVYTRSRGEISTVDGGVQSELPDIVTRLSSFKIYGNYHFSETLVLNGTFWHERYSSSDWALDGVAEDTVPNNLSLGQEAPSYDVNVFMLSMRYRF